MYIYIYIERERERGREREKESPTVIKLIIEKSEIKYSFKNLPITLKKFYQLNRIDKIESLVKRMR